MLLSAVAAWTQANYVFEQLTKLHEVLAVSPRTRDAEAKPGFTKQQIVALWKHVRKSDAYSGARAARDEGGGLLAL